jgi:hypothetical protein
MKVRKKNRDTGNRERVGWKCLAGKSGNREEQPVKK